MDIKKRMIISNTLTVIIPFMIASLAAIIFISISSKLFDTSINYDKFKKSAYIKSEILNTVREISKSNIKDIHDTQFQKFLNQKLSLIDGKIIIIKNDSIVFSSQDMNKIDIQNSLDEANNKTSPNMVSIESTFYSVESFPLEFNNNLQGKVIFLTPIRKETNILKNFIIAILSIFLISSALTSILVSYMFSKKILNPITSLKKAMSEIRHGDLNFEIAETGDKEIKELCTDFEQMRIKLKDSINIKMKYDDNRKMLLSSISHDLKTPITSIEGYVQGILDGVANTPEKLEHYLKTIHRKTRQINAMIDDLLLYSKLDLKQIPFNYEKTDIIDYFNYCILESEPELKKLNMKISLQNHLKNSKYVMIDKERFMRVILNIIDNSKKYMDKKKGEVSIFLRETTLSIIIEIKDNGCGISKNNVSKIFNKFYREDSSRSNACGSGLGLAISKQIVEGHNGKIWAVSTENKGTSILISLEKID
ncbi:sensor histidine kinase [Clostridium sp. WILCCON 0269]|uniref:histidine kinase n=1 Tax=Candidatus Clostridium eludens TaxID=3381663 RepID=A0ABW8SHH6_9CLOT